MPSASRETRLQAPTGSSARLGKLHAWCVASRFQKVRGPAQSEGPRRVLFSALSAHVCSKEVGIDQVHDDTCRKTLHHQCHTRPAASAANLASCATQHPQSRHSQQPQHPQHPLQQSHRHQRHDRHWLRSLHMVPQNANGLHPHHSSKSNGLQPHHSSRDPQHTASLVACRPSAAPASPSLAPSAAQQMPHMPHVRQPPLQKQYRSETTNTSSTNAAPTAITVQPSQTGQTRLRRRYKHAHNPAHVHGRYPSGMPSCSMTALYCVTLPCIANTLAACYTHTGSISRRIPRGGVWKFCPDGPKGEASSMRCKGSG